MTIRRQQFVLFFGTTVLLITILALVIFLAIRSQILAETSNHLDAVAQTQKNRIKEMIGFKYEIMSAPANDKSIINALSSYADDSSLNIQPQLKPVLDSYKNTFDDWELFHLTDMAGKVIASNVDTLIGHDMSDNDGFLNASQGEKYLNGLHLNAAGNLNIFLAVPVEVNHVNKGVLIADIDASHIFGITSDYTGLGRTGETTLGKQYGDTIWYITPLRFDSLAALRRYLTPEDSNLTMYQAISSQEGIFTSVDYRGKEVLSSARYISESDWGLVTKMDYEEATSSINYLRNSIIIFILVASGIAFVIAYFSAKQLVLPIKELIEATNRVKEGIHSERINRNTNNELGELARSFNEMADNLEKKIQDLDRFAYVLSHDLKAPLKSIGPLASIVKEEKELDDEGNSMMDMILLKVKHMEELIEGVLETTRQRKNVKQPLKVRPIINNIISNLDAPANIHFFIQHDLPKTIDYNKTNLVQVLQNLISNAIKFIDKPEGLIRIGYTDIGTHHQFCVADNGIGIPEDKIDSIFKEFSIAHSSENISSHGIGLSVVKRIVWESGGNVWAESKEGEGAKFLFTIPK